MTLAFRQGTQAGERALWALGGLISMAFGAVLAIRPDDGAVTLATAFGLFSIISGINAIVLSKQARRTHDTAERLTGSTTREPAPAGSEPLGLPSVKALGRPSTSTTGMRATDRRGRPRRQQQQGGRQMTMSENLSRLSVRAKEAEASVAAASAEARERLEQDVESARRRTQETADRMKQRTEQTKKQPT